MSDGIGSVYWRGKSWAWSFTTGSRKDGTRRPHQKAGYPTREAAEIALRDARARWLARQTPRRIEPVTALVDWSIANLNDLVDAGICEPQCIMAGSPIEVCDCRCEGAHHGASRFDAGAAITDEERLRRTAVALDRLVVHRDELIAHLRSRGRPWSLIGKLIGQHPAHLSRKWASRDREAG